MEYKKHYKMYKSGKLWVSAAIATGALVAGMTLTTSASAADNQPVAGPTTTETSTTNNGNSGKATQPTDQNQQVNNKDQENTTGQDNQTTTDQTTTGKKDNQSSDQSTAGNKSDQGTSDQQTTGNQDDHQGTSGQSITDGKADQGTTNDQPTTGDHGNHEDTSDQPTTDNKDTPNGNDQSTAGNKSDQGTNDQQTTGNQDDHQGTNGQSNTDGKADQGTTNDQPTTGDHGNHEDTSDQPTTGDKDTPNGNDQSTAGNKADQGTTSNQPSTDDKDDHQDASDQTQTDTVVFTRTITYYTVDKNGHRTPTGEPDSQTATIHKITDGKQNHSWEPATVDFDNYDIIAKDGYYAKVDGQFTDQVPAAKFDPDKVKQNIDVEVDYVPSTRTVKATDKDADQANQVKTVTRTINFTAPAGAALPAKFQQPIKQTVTLNRDMFVDVKDATKVTYGDWTVADGAWAKVDISIADYDSLVNGQAKQYVDAADFSDLANLQDLTVTVSYRPAAGNKDVNFNIKGNYGVLDGIEIKNNQLHVVGWNATNDSQGKPYHYIFVLNGQGQEIGRYQVDTLQSNRPDVFNAYPVWNATKSGFDVNIPLDISKIKVGDQLFVMSRWTNDPQGNVINNQAVDYRFPNAYTIKNSANPAYLDSFATYGNNQLKVTGWHANDLSLNYPNHWLILFDATANREIARQKATVVERKDVAKAYPAILNADMSGFEGVFNLKGINLSDNLQVISRYSSDAAKGEGHRVDYWFPAQKLMHGSTEVKGNLDTFELKNGRVHVAGWNATDWSTVTQNHFLILWDQTSGRQVAAQLTNNVARPDVARAYPNIKTAGNSGFDFSFDPVVLTPGHTYTLISRYSTSNQGNGDTGANVTYRFTNKNLAFNPNRANVAHLDNVAISNGKLQVNGWHATEMSEFEPNHWLILLNHANQEVARVKVNNNARPDVANAYRNIKTAGTAGFGASFDNLKLAPGTYTLVSRYAIDPNNASQYTDYWFKNAITIGAKQQAYSVDHSTQNDDGTFHVTGWMASNQTMRMKQPNAFLILVNNQGTELGRTQVKLAERSDVAKVFPMIYNSAVSGFDADINFANTTPIDDQTNEGLQLYLRFTDASDGNPTAEQPAVDQIASGYLIKDGKLVKKA